MKITGNYLKIRFSYFLSIGKAPLREKQLFFWNLTFYSLLSGKPLSTLKDETATEEGKKSAILFIIEVERKKLKDK